MTECRTESSAEVVVDLNEKKPIRVLHVDDEPSLLKITTQCLEMQGPFRVDSASSVEEALEKLEKEQYDAVVSDYQMPGKDGLQFLEELRENGNRIPFIMFTGRGREEVAVKAWNLGADHYVNKTGDPETVYCELAHCLRSAVEKHVAEARIRETSRKLQTIYENAVEGISYVDAEEQIVFANKAFADIIGIEQDQLVGMSLHRMVDDESWAKIRSETERRRQGESSRYEAVFRRSDGTVRNVLISGAPLRDHYGQFAGTVGVVLDITEQKKAEEELEESEGKFRQIFQNANDSMTYLSSSGRILDVNERTVQIFGGSREELLGKHFSQIGVISLKNVPSLMKVFADGLAGRCPTLNIHIRNRKGKELRLECSGSLIKRENEITMLVIARDITERKAAEEATRESEEKWRSLAGMVPDGIVTADLKGMITSVNDAFLRLTGYAKEEIVGKHFTKLQTIQARDIPRYLKLSSLALRGRLPPPFDYSYVRKDGSIGWAEAQFRFLKRNGKTIGLQVFLRETTELKRSEDALCDAKEKWKSLTENTDDIVMIVDANGIIQFINRTIPPYTPEETIGKTVYEYVPREQHDMLKKTLREVFKTGKPNRFEVSSSIPKSGITWFNTKAVPIKRGGKVSEVILVSADTTDQKKAQKEASEVAETWRTTFDSISDFVFVLNKDQRFVKANKAMCDVLNKEPRELIGKHCFEVLHGTDEPWPTCPFKKTQATGEVTTEEVNDPNLGVPLLVTVSPILDGEGAFAGVVHIAKDITERKKADHERDRLVKDLGERVKELRCLLKLSKLVENPSVSLDGVLQGTVDLLPGAWQYPDITCARIVIERQEFSTANFRETQWGQQAEIKVSGSKAGFVEVFYLKEKPPIAEGPFLKEERDLLDAVAERLGRVIERLRAEVAAKESQEKFEGLFMGNPEAAVYLEPDFHIQNVNPCFEKLFGYSLHEIKGKHINDVIVPVDKLEEAQTLDDHACQGYARHNTVRKRKDGSLVPVSISAARMTLEGKLQGYIGLYRDITDLKEAYHESEEAKKHFQALFNLMADPVAIVDGKGKVLETTSRVHEITGFRKEELVGKNFLKLKMFEAKAKAAMIKSLAKRMLGMHVSPYEIEIVTKEGKKLPYEINAAKIDYKGKPADLVVFHDISERKKFEEKLRIVGGLTRHDVRNKLTAVAGNAYLLKKRFAGDPNAMECLDGVEAAVRESQRIFDFASAYEKLGVEELVYLDVAKILGEAIALFPDSKGIRIVNDCGGLTLLADSLLRQLFYNLIDNSLKYGEKLTQIRIRCERSEDPLSLIYEDDGIGISHDTKPKLFNEGYSTGRGSGYGLYLIRKIMTVYGWTIEETGEPSKGARFVMTIPRMNEQGKELYRLH